MTNGSGVADDIILTSLSSPSSDYYDDVNLDVDADVNVDDEQIIVHYPNYIVIPLVVCTSIVACCIVMNPSKLKKLYYQYFGYNNITTTTTNNDSDLHQSSSSSQYYNEQMSHYYNDEQIMMDKQNERRKQLLMEQLRKTIESHLITRNTSTSTITSISTIGSDSSTSTSFFTTTSTVVANNNDTNNTNTDNNTKNDIETKTNTSCNSNQNNETNHNNTTTIAGDSNKINDIESQTINQSISAINTSSSSSSSALSLLENGNDDHCNNNNDNFCQICMEEYKVDDENENVEEIAFSNNKNCIHSFHKKCIVDWLVVKSCSDIMNNTNNKKNDKGYGKCPICRNDFIIITENHDTYIDEYIGI